MEKDIGKDYDSPQEVPVDMYNVPLDATPKGRWERSWPTIACGAGLFSDGYLNNVCNSLSPRFLVAVLM